MPSKAEAGPRRQTLKSISSWLVAGILAAGTLGCSDGPATYEVFGKVSYQGEPVTSGLINFQPPEGSPLGGGIEPDGTYAFELPAGEYRVRIDAPAPLPEGFQEGDPLPEMGKRLVPEQFARFASSNLHATVQAGDEPQEINFALE